MSADTGVVPGGRANPTEEELLAIVAAMEAVWPRPMAVAAVAPKPSSWRFSGRPWARPATARRDRPWY